MRRAIWQSDYLDFEVPLEDGQASDLGWDLDPSKALEKYYTFINYRLLGLAAYMGAKQLIFIFGQFVYDFFLEMIIIVMYSLYWNEIL